MSAKPFSRGWCQRKGDNSPQARTPQKHNSSSSRCGVEQSQAGLRQRDCERHQPGEALGFDQEGLTDPEQACEKIAEAEPPADSAGVQCAPYCRARSCCDPLGSTLGGTVDQ